MFKSLIVAPLAPVESHRLKYLRIHSEIIRKPGYMVVPARWSVQTEAWTDLIKRLTQKGQRNVRLLIGLSQNRHTCLLDNLVPRERCRFAREVGILDAAS